MFTELKDRIEIKPGVLHGKPHVKGTKIPVYLIISLLAEGSTIDEIVKDNPALDTDDITAALFFSANLSQEYQVKDTGSNRESFQKQEKSILALEDAHKQQLDKYKKKEKILWIILFSSIIAVIVLLIANSNSNKTKMELREKKAELHLKNMQQLYNLIFDSKILIKNWIHVDEKDNTPEKLRLRAILFQEIPQTKEELIKHKSNWTKEEIMLFDYICKQIDDLTEQQKAIMEQLNSYENYNNLFTIFQVAPLVEEDGEISKTTNGILSSISQLIQQQEDKLRQ